MKPRCLCLCWALLAALPSLAQPGRPAPAAGSGRTVSSPDFQPSPQAKQYVFNHFSSFNGLAS
ncbi:MAG TPA: hypothetical protein VG870_13670, partial [Chitinophagaceae bacterium]|nr:hypothetical protein [Chitinophagaceae bacterium]